MSKSAMARRGQDSLIVLVKTLHQALRAALDHALASSDQTLPQQAVMVTLGRMPGASNAELARAAFVSPQSMGELLQSLEGKGWIERTPSARSARVLETKVTPAGARAVARAGVELAKVEARLVGALLEGEEPQLRDMLHRCLAALGDANEAATALARAPRRTSRGSGGRSP